MNKTYKLWSKYPIIAMDTEYDEVTKKPFLATTTDEQLVCQVYRLDKPDEYRAFKRLCENPKLVKVWHQCTADMNSLLNIGITLVPPYEDTMIMASLMNENFARIGLKELARVFLKVETTTQTKLRTVINRLKKKAVKEGRTFSWKDIPLQTMIPYAKDDPLYTMKLFYLWKRGIRDYWGVYEFEKRLIPVIVQMEQNGFLIDRKLVQQRKAEYEAGMVRSYEHMMKVLNTHLEVEGEFNPGSPPQLVQVLEALGAPLVKETKTGYSTDAEVLQELSVAKTIILNKGERELQVPRAVNQFVKHVLDYRFFKKHLSTYYLPLLCRYTTPKEHHAHFDFYQSGARTGRFSAELLQTFPRPEEARRSGHKHEVRHCVKVARGEVIVCIDMDQMELRLFAHFANATRLIKAFAMGKDAYVQVSEDLFGKEMMQDPELYKVLRWVGKKIVLGIIFGMGKWKMIWTLLYELPNVASRSVIQKIGMNEQRASDTLAQFHAMYPVREHSNALMSEIHKTGELRLDLESPLLSIHRAYRVPQELSYKGVNVEIQGTAAYAIKAAMLRCADRLQEPLFTKRQVRMIGTVHDELIFYAKRDAKLPVIIHRLRKEIEDRVSFRVPLTASPKVSCRSWGAVQEWDGQTKTLEPLLCGEEEK